MYWNWLLFSVNCWHKCELLLSAMTFYQLWINFKILLFDHIPFRNCLKKPRSVTDSTWPGDIRAVGRSDNPGVPVLFGRHNLPPLVEVELIICQNMGVPWHPLHPHGRQACTACQFLLWRISDNCFGKNCKFVL